MSDESSRRPPLQQGDDCHPAWMAGCPACARWGLLSAEERRDHLVNGHLAELPYYLPGCAQCQRLKACAAELVAAAAPGHIVVYGHADLAHRAGHLLGDIDWRDPRLGTT